MIDEWMTHIPTTLCPGEAPQAPLASLHSPSSANIFSALRSELRIHGTGLGWAGLNLFQMAILS